MSLFVRGALLLDAAMSVQAAVRLLAQHGFWLDPHQAGPHSWLEEYIDRVAELMSRAGSAAHPTLADAARLLERPAAGEWAAVRRQSGVTIFWYAFPVTDLLDAFARAAPVQTLLDGLKLHEHTSTLAVQVEDIPASSLQMRVILNGQDLVGIKMSESGGYGFERTFRGSAREDEGPAKAAVRSTEEAADVTVRGCPFLDAPEKVTVGVRFELEIGLSEAPVDAVVTTGALVLQASAGVTTVPVEVQVLADGAFPRRRVGGGISTWLSAIRRGSE